MKLHYIITLQFEADRLGGQVLAWEEGTVEDSGSTGETFHQIMDGLVAKTREKCPGRTLNNPVPLFFSLEEE
jgi:hypothetical protein